MNYYQLFKLYEALLNISINDIDIVKEENREAFIVHLEELQEVLAGVFLSKSNDDRESP